MLLKVENVLRCMFVIGIGAVFEKLHCDIWKRTIELENLNNQDPLTHLYNRSYAEKYYENMLNENRLYAVLYYDLDNFKKVNDTFGHDCGDEVLLMVSDSIDEVFGEAGIVARLGGDEFLAIIEVLNIQSLIEKVHIFLNRYPRLIKGKVKIHSSVGIALSSVGYKKNFKEICIEADTAMYEAKKRGKGRAFLSANCLTEEIEITKEEKNEKETDIG